MAEYPSYTAVHRRRLGLPCCCCPYWNSLPHRITSTTSMSFPGSHQGFPLQIFLPMTFTATFVVLPQWQCCQTITCNVTGCKFQALGLLGLLSGLCRDKGRCKSDTSKTTIYGTWTREGNIRLSGLVRRTLLASLLGSWNCSDRFLARNSML